jgi:hypothetical protein
VIAPGLVGHALAFASRLVPLRFFALPVRWIDAWLDGEADVPMTPIEEENEFSAIGGCDEREEF